MKTVAATVGILITVLFSYLAFNLFELPIFFWWQKRATVKGVVTQTDWVFWANGSRIQKVKYCYKVNDSLYFDKFKAGRTKGKQTIGDSLLIEYGVANPQKNQVIGFYRLH